MTAFDNVLDQCLAVTAGEEVVLLADDGTDPDVVAGLTQRNSRTGRHPAGRPDAEPEAARAPSRRAPWPR